MKYIYRMSWEMYYETSRDAARANMTVPEYITENFGLLGECVKVEII